MRSRSLSFCTTAADTSVLSPLANSDGGRPVHRNSAVAPAA